jgi:predicted CopG family antitoxin
MRQSAASGVSLYVGSGPREDRPIDIGEPKMYIYKKGRLMKRLHILLDDGLYERLKSAAAGRRESLADVIRGYLRSQLDREMDKASFPTFTSSEIEEILRIMDARES